MKFHMQNTTGPDNPQNPLSRRLFLISPRPSFFERLGISQEHPASEIVGIITPRLPHETWFEGWRRQWRTKAKHDFLESFRDFGSSAYAPAVIAADFINELSTGEPVDHLFDKWWTIRDHLDLLEIEETWRPSL
jgi:hypothetical protein